MKTAACSVGEFPLVRHVSATFASQVGALGLGFGSSILLNRSLGPEGKGIYATVLTTAQLLVLVASLGLTKSATFHLASREEDQKAVFQNVLVLTALTLLLTLALLGACALLPIPHRVFQTGHLHLVAVLAIFTLLLSLGQSALRGLKQFAACNVAQLVTAGLFLGLLALFAVRGRLDATLAVLCKAGALAFVLALVWSQLRGCGLPFEARASAALLKKLFSYGFGFFFYTTFQNLNYRFDLLLVANLTTLADAGWYSTGTGLAEIIWYFPNAVGLVLFPVAAGLEGKASDALIARVCRWSLLLMAAGVIGMLAVAPLAITLLFGAAFLPTVNVLYALSPGIVANGLFQILSVHLAARQQLRWLTFITGVGFCLNLLLNLVAIPRWGIIGAGLASTCSYTVTGLLTARFFLRTTGLFWKQLWFIPADEAAVVSRTLRAKLGWPHPNSSA
jgi:O-antigen/teichoic acid export membrane protein